MDLRKLWNYFAKSYYYFHRKLKCSGFPEIYNIELTNRCIMDCAMCPHKYLTREKGDMNFELYKKIIDQLKPYANNVLTLHGIGGIFNSSSSRRVYKICQRKRGETKTFR